MRKIFLIIGFLFLACQNEKAPKIILVDTKVEVIDKNVSKQAAKLSIDGMMCAIGCAATIEKNLSKTQGVVSAQIDFESKNDTLRFKIISYSYAFVTRSTVYTLKYS